MDKKLRASRYKAYRWALALVSALGLLPPQGLGAEPFAYVSHSLNLVSVIRTTDQTLIGEVAVGENPTGVALTPDGAFAYVAHQEGVSVIRTADQTVVATVAIAQGNCQGIALSPDGSHAYVANAGRHSVSVIRTTDQTTIGEVAVGQNPSGVALTPNGAFAYVTNWGSNSVSVIRTLDDAVVVTVAVGQNPSGVAISPNGETAYVIEGESGQLALIHVSNHLLSARVPVGSHPRGLALSSPLSLPQIMLHLSQTVISTQDTLQLDLHLLTPEVIPPGGNYRFEAKLWLKTPLPFPQDRISIISLAGPAHSVNMPAGADQSFRLWNGPLPTDLVVSGLYAIGASLADPVTGKEISLDIQPFSITNP